MNVKSKTKGFTIIEVVLVLAIAGLIFLIVFLAVPALQRQQRDTQRRSDASRVSSMLANFKANNNGALPTTTQQTGATGFIQRYVKNADAGNQAAPTGAAPATGDEVRSPANNLGYNVEFAPIATAPTASTATAAETMVIHLNASCNGESAVAATGKYAVRVILENGGFYCVGEN